MIPDQLSRSQARRVALASQGFLDPPHARPTMRTLTRAVQRTGVLQIDSVNVLQRAHFMPLFSRLGPYDTGLLERATSHPPRRLVEYWAHCAADMPVGLWPFMRHRMADYARQGHAWFGLPDDPALPEALVQRIRDDGPATARQLDEGTHRDRGHWGWNWSLTKKALEYLFFAGRLSVARRNSAFERVYDLTERVLPAAILDQPTPSPSEVTRELVRLAARSHGVASEICLRDYYRLFDGRHRVIPIRQEIADLVGAGELLPVRVEGWKRPAYLHRDARLPRTVDACALLSPFDPVVWERDRTQALFDFFYRIEIYVPEAKRVHGYYVLPFLLGERIVARVDLKAERSTGALIVNAAFAEPHAPEHTAAALAGQLHRLAGWLGLHQVRVEPRGDLSASLAAQCAAADFAPIGPGW